jgi:hypothetical protein
MTVHRTRRGAAQQQPAQETAGEAPAVQDNPPANRNWGRHAPRPGTGAPQWQSTGAVRTPGAAADRPRSDLSSVIKFYGGATPGLTGNIVGLKEGNVSIDTGTNPYTRNYNPTTEGELRKRHGSPVPPSTAFDAAEQATLQQTSPGNALDAMAKLMGATTGFEKMANAPEFFNPNEKAWMGNCAGWSWSANNKALSKAVDVDGQAGQKGVWFGGQFLSRADLGNWAMAVSNKLATAQTERSNTQSVGHPGPLEVLYSLQALQKDGPGLVANVWNDAAHGNHQVWNQPVHGADIEVSKVPDEVKDKILELAQKDGWRASDVKLVRTEVHYGQEAGQSYEGPTNDRSKNWNMYVVQNDDGEVRWGIMANDPRLRDVQGLPEKSSDSLPDYINLMPTDMIDDAMAGRTIGFDDSADKKEFEFFMGKVLPNAVPAYVRTQFERELQSNDGALTDRQKAQLAAKYPKIANAYSPDQWQKFGLDPAKFGAVWPR